MKLTTILRLFPPIRIFEIIALLSAFQIIHIAWQSEHIIFYFFFPIIAGSVIFETILYKVEFKEIKFKEGFKKVGIKYYSGIGIQFVGSAVSALASFNTDPEKIPVIIMYTVLLLGIGGLLEAFHVFTEKKFKNVQLSPAWQILAVIGFTIMIFFFGLYTVLVLIPRTPWFG
jgi:hypothetical protein